MLNFVCSAATDDFALNDGEVDRADWFSFEDSKAAIADGSLAERFLCAYLQDNYSL